MKKIIVLFICTLSFSYAFTQQQKMCIHYHCDNPAAKYPCNEVIHIASKEKIKDYSKLSGKLSFKLNGQYYEFNEETVHCYNQPSSARTGANIISAKLNDSTSIFLSYNYYNKKWMGKYERPSPNVVRENCTIIINNKSYSNFTKQSEAPTLLNLTVTCAWQYGTANPSYLLNGTFSGELRDKETGAIVKITEGKFCSAAYNF
jgi:hypothetical protein